MSRTAGQPTNTLLNRYFNEIRSYPALDRSDEHRIARDAQGGNLDARDALVQSNLSFVVKIASEYRNLGLPFEDLLNEGNVGLIEAANRFDHTKGTKFITYAIWWIRKSILKALSERSNLIRVPYYQMQRVREFRETEERLRRELGRAPRRAEVAAALSRQQGQIDRSLQYSMRPVDLDQKIGESERSIADLLPDDSCNDAELDLLDREAHSMIERALSELTLQEQRVVGLRFGLGGEHAMTLREVGGRLGISRERVRQIEAKATQRMRRFFARRTAAQQSA